MEMFEVEAKLIGMCCQSRQNVDLARSLGLGRDHFNDPRYMRMFLFMSGEDYPLDYADTELMHQLADVAPLTQNIDPYAIAMINNCKLTKVHRRLAVISQMIIGRHPFEPLTRIIDEIEDLALWITGRGVDQVTPTPNLPKPT